MPDEVLAAPAPTSDRLVPEHPAQATDEPRGLQDAIAFHDALLAQGLIIPTVVPGVFGHSARFEQVLEAVNNLITRACFQDGAELISFPPVLNPADCCPLYPALRGTLPEGGRLITMLSWVFRHAPSHEPLCAPSPDRSRMQSFRVREFVRAGERDEVRYWRDMWLQRSVELMGSVQLQAGTEVASEVASAVAGDGANDAYFAGDCRLPASAPCGQRLKHRLLVLMGARQPRLAIASLKLHQQHFGSMFEIRSAGGTPAHTACLGFGLARVTLALFRAHGLDVSRWPGPVREQLWP